MSLRFIAIVGLLGVAGTVRCTDQIRVGAFTTSVIGDGSVGGGGGQGGIGGCVKHACQSHYYNCGNCIDDDSDGLIDSDDPDCLSPCQNSEDTFAAAIPGGSSDKCVQDCYFDQDTGAGNDKCLWSRTCDELEVAPNYDPLGPDCAFDPNTMLTQLGLARTCDMLKTAQDPQCATLCGPLTPNGCDCFGCCTAEGAPTPIWIGSADSAGNPTCDLEHLSDPTRCRPCTQVPSCVNPCDHCELCVGKRELPADCMTDSGPIGQCADGIAPCGLPDQPPCPAGSYCVTGCCAVLVY